MIRGLLKKSIFIIITFVGISFICTTIFTMTASIIASIDQQNGYLTEDSLEINLLGIGRLTKEDLEEFKKIDKDMLLYKEDSGNVIRGVYCSGNKIPKVKMMEGRYFTEEDFKSDKKLAVVGKNKIQECVIKNGKRYYVDEDNEYEVIGVMGYEHKYTMLDAWIHFSMSGVYSINEEWASIGTYILECGERTNETSKKIKAYIMNKFPNASVEIRKNKEVSSHVDGLFIGMITESMTVILLIICIALNTVSLTSDWIDNRRKELAIKKAFGATDRIISKAIKSEYLIIVTISFGIGFILSVVSIKLGILKTLGTDIYWIATLVSYLVCLLIGIITVRIPIKKAEKLQVSEIMR